MDSPLVLLIVCVVAVGVAYWSLRRRDRKLRQRGATEAQVEARSQAEIDNSWGAYGVIVGLILSFFGAWSAIEAHLNSDPIPWGHFLLLFTLGVGLICIGGWRIKQAAKLKRFSEAGLDKNPS